jgi:hypothetical protein
MYFKVLGYLLPAQQAHGGEGPLLLLPPARQGPQGDLIARLGAGAAAGCGLPARQPAAARQAGVLHAVLQQAPRQRPAHTHR